jgi:hypothetical protein
MKVFIFNKHMWCYKRRRVKLLKAASTSPVPDLLKLSLLLCSHLWIGLSVSLEVPVAAAQARAKKSPAAAEVSTCPSLCPIDGMAPSTWWPVADVDSLRDRGGAEGASVDGGGRRRPRPTGGSPLSGRKKLARNRSCFNIR